MPATSALHFLHIPPGSSWAGFSMSAGCRAAGPRGCLTRRCQRHLLPFPKSAFSDRTAEPAVQAGPAPTWTNWPGQLLCPARANIPDMVTRLTTNLPQTLTHNGTARLSAARRHHVPWPAIERVMPGCRRTAGFHRVLHGDALTSHLRKAPGPAPQGHQARITKDPGKARDSAKPDWEGNRILDLAVAVGAFWLCPLIRA